MPTKNTLRILVSLQIAALLGASVAASVSIQSMVRDYRLPTELFGVSPEIFWLANIVSIALLAVAIGLCYFADIFRTLYVALTVAALLLHSLRPSFSSGSMDLLHETDAVLRGAIIALIYFSPLSDLYKPRPPGDLRSTQRLFRYLILAQIPLLLISIGVGFLSSRGTDIAAISDYMDSSHPGRGVLAGISLLAYVIVNICLYKFWKGARGAYLIVTVAAILEALYLSPSVSAAGTEIFTTAISIVNGALLGLAYYSPLRALFDAAPGTPAAIGASPVVPPPPVESPGMIASQPPTGVASATTATWAPSHTIGTAPATAPAGVAHAGAAPRPAVAEHTAFCEACGERSQGGKFCIACGAPLPRKLLCPSCGAESQPGKKFCRECGTSLPGQ